MQVLSAYFRASDQVTEAARPQGDFEYSKSRQLLEPENVIKYVTTRTFK